MVNLTPEEKKVVLFLLCLTLCGLALSNLIKIKPQVEKIVFPQVQLARVNLNKVGLEELTGFKCISAKLAQRIIEYRNFHQEFVSLEELKDVKGVGEQRYEKLKEIFFVE